VWAVPWPLYRLNCPTNLRVYYLCPSSLPSFPHSFSLHCMFCATDQGQASSKDFKSQSHSSSSSSASAARPYCHGPAHRPLFSADAAAPSVFSASSAPSAPSASASSALLQPKPQPILSPPPLLQTLTSAAKQDPTSSAASLYHQPLFAPPPAPSKPSIPSASASASSAAFVLAEAAAAAAQISAFKQWLCPLCTYENEPVLSRWSVNPSPPSVPCFWDVV
jgi:hypothetical protein